MARVRLEKALFKKERAQRTLEKLQKDHLEVQTKSKESTGTLHVIKMQLTSEESKLKNLENQVYLCKRTLLCKSFQQKGLRAVIYEYVPIEHVPIFRDVDGRGDTVYDLLAHLMCEKKWLKFYYMIDLLRNRGEFPFMEYDKYKLGLTSFLNKHSEFTYVEDGELQPSKKIENLL